MGKCAIVTWVSFVAKWVESNRSSTTRGRTDDNRWMFQRYWDADRESALCRQRRFPNPSSIHARAVCFLLDFWFSLTNIAGLVRFFIGCRLRGVAVEGSDSSSAHFLNPHASNSKHLHDTCLATVCQSYLFAQQGRQVARMWLHNHNMPASWNPVVNGS